MKTTMRTTFLATTAALLMIPAANAGGLGGALGGTVGGTLGGSFGNSMGMRGGSGSADGYGHGDFGAPDLGRPLGRVRDAGDRVTQRGSETAGHVRDRAGDAKASAAGSAKGIASGTTQALDAAKADAAAGTPPSGESHASGESPVARPVLDPNLGGDGALGGSAGAETQKHEALLDAGTAGSAHADRSGAQADVKPTASAKAGRKAPPAESGASTPAP